MEEYRIRFIEMPYTINGVTVEDAYGFYNIYINSLLSYKEQQKAIKHELTHIKRDDFYSTKPLQYIENIN